MKDNIFRDGKVHVMQDQCKTCIFRPGNLMKLAKGRVAGMVRSATAANSTIVCHNTLDGDNAVCHGFYEQHATLPIRLAEATGAIAFVEEA